MQGTNPPDYPRSLTQIRSSYLSDPWRCSHFQLDEYASRPRSRKHAMHKSGQHGNGIMICRNCGEVFDFYGKDTE